jgi:hypothetical protein
LVLQVLDVGSFFITPVNSASLTVTVTGYRSGALKSGASVTLTLSTATPHQQVFLPQPSFTGVDTVSPRRQTGVPQRHFRSVNFEVS